jgi:hypothetical protein
MRFLIVLKLIHLAAAFVSSPATTTPFRISLVGSRVFVIALSAKQSDLPPNDYIRVWYQLVDAKSGAFDNDGVDDVEISCNALISNLRQAIIDKNKFPFVAKSLKVFANREDLELMEPQIKPFHPLPYTTGETPLYVVVPYLVSPLEQDPISEPPPLLKTDVSPERLKRWQLLNEILAKNKKARSIAEGTTTAAYSGVTWDEVEPVYLPIKDYDLQPMKVNEEMLDSLYEYLTKATNVFGTVARAGGNEAKNLHFVAPILVHVCNLFDDDADKIHILVDATVQGKRINVIDGRFEFVLQRKNKRICIIEAKKFDLNQGLAQDLLGCEAVADQESLNCVYGIVTNYVTWTFVKSLDTRIETYAASLQEGSKESLARICGLIFAMLSE